MAQTKAYNYYLGPWVWDTEEGGYWKAPENTVGLLDLRSVPNCGKKTIPDGYGFFAVDGTLPAPYYLIGNGYIEQVPINNAMKSKIKQYLGYKPTASNLRDVLWEIMTNGSDPTGENGVKPLVPNINDVLELHLGGHSRIKHENFAYGIHPHTQKIKELVRNDYKKYRQKCIQKGSNHYRKVLDAYGEKYKVVRPQDEFIPDDLPKETPLPHETTLDEDFNTDDSDTLGPNYTWDEITGDFDIVSNKAACQTNSAYAFARCDSTLSGSDHYARIWNGFPSRTGTQLGHGVFARSDDSTYANLNAYRGIYWQSGNMGGGYGSYIDKIVSGTHTNLAPNQNATWHQDHTLECDGTTITNYEDYEGSKTVRAQVTDSAVSSGSYVGIIGWTNTAEDPAIDEFIAADLGAGGATIPIMDHKYRMQRSQ